MTSKQTNRNTSNQPISRPIVALDPGHTTGVAVYHPDTRSVSIRQFAATQQIGMIKYLFAIDPAIVVYEQYVARPTRHNHLGAEATRQLSPVYVHGIVLGAFLATRKPLEMPTFHPQQASEMAAFPDKRLRAMFPNLYPLTLRPAKPHARDALRHLLVYLKRMHFDHYQALKPEQ